MTADQAHVAALLEFVRAHGRVCPIPRRWHELWKMLPGRERDGGGWSPPLPLILGAWWEASPTHKAQQLSEHIAWAADHGVLNQVDAFLRQLTEVEWCHEDDL